MVTISSDHNLSYIFGIIIPDRTVHSFIYNRQFDFRSDDEIIFLKDFKDFLPLSQFSNVHLCLFHCIIPMYF